MKRSAQYLCDWVNLLMLMGNKNECILKLKDRENMLLKRYYRKVNENISIVDKYIKQKQRDFTQFFSSIHNEFQTLSRKFDQLFYHHPDGKYPKEKRIQKKLEFSQTMKKVLGEISKHFGNIPASLSYNLDNVLADYKKESEILNSQFRFFSERENDLRNALNIKDPVRRERSKK